MWHRCALAPLPSSEPGVELDCVWEVKADASYDVRRNPNTEHGRGLIALRTLGGQGIIDLIGASDLSAESNSLLILPWERILRYRWGAGVWHFHWFELRPLGPVNLPLARILTVPPLPDEERDMAQCFELLQGGDSRSHAAGSAHFTSLFWRWLSHAGQTENEDASMAAAVAVLQAACQRPGAVTQAAVAAGVGERRLRQIFQNRLGTSPKAFAEKLRLDLAGRYLHQGGMTVTKVAELMGYSSPFHFSRAFKRHFGVPPSKW